MEAIKIQTLDRAIKMLQALNCQFAIIDEEGGKHGALEEKKAKESHRFIRMELFQRMYSHTLKIFR